MKLYLQFGHGMMGICRELLPNMPNASVVLSPRDLKESQIEKFGNDIIKIGGSTLLDPQLYAPRCDHQKLTNHTYWPADYSTASMNYNAVLSELKALNDKAQTSAFILPGLYCERVNDLWLNIHDDIISAADSYTGRKLGTLCLSAETIRFQDQLDQLLSRTATWNVDGYYVIAGHPNGEYLVDDPVWLSNLLAFCAGLKLQKNEVILGYSNHQMLCVAGAGIDALASGSWMNVRSFTLDKFFTADPEDVKRKRTWYYCPQALTEVKPEFLDIAFQRSVLKLLTPLPEYNSGYADMLFSGAIPTTTIYDETTSFKHYLTCLWRQCQIASKPSFDETISFQRKSLKDAGKLIDFLHKHGVRGQNRDFEDYIDVTLSAIDTFEADKGFLLRRMWNSL